MMTFTARVIPGAGRGGRLGVPTLNLNLDDVPKDLPHGIYACRVGALLGALHYGPRPVFDDSVSCEVHLIDTVVAIPPTEVKVEIVQRLRDIKNFDSEEDLIWQMNEDIRSARRAILPHP